MTKPGKIIFFFISNATPELRTFEGAPDLILKIKLERPKYFIKDEKPINFLQWIVNVLIFKEKND